MTAHAEPSIAISGLSHRYGEKFALNDLALEIPQRSIFGVLGPNGSGKSTLFTKNFCINTISILVLKTRSWKITPLSNIF
jgi:ABC-2 type transport system ATP-binding protein